MCTSPDKRTTQEFRNRKGRQHAYKVIDKWSGRPSLFADWGFRYRSGHNVDPRATRKTYAAYLRRGSGFHCYLNRKAACYQAEGSGRLTVVCVSFDPVDVIAAEASQRDGRRNTHQQIVVRALNISQRAWNQAGLPDKAAGTGGRRKAGR